MLLGDWREDVVLMAMLLDDILARDDVTVHLDDALVSARDSSVLSRWLH
jgi:hypothetical protein